MTPTPTTERAWLRGQYEAVELTPEASARRYARSLHPDAAGWLRVTSESPAPRAITDFLLEQEVRVPRIGLEVDGVYLVEDFGDLHLHHQATPAHYAALLGVHRRYFLAELPVGHPNRKLALDASLFRRELRLFLEVSLTQRAGRDFDSTEVAALTQALDRLADLACEGPQALQHRDLHSRNVLIHEGAIVLIDHQDMRRGPLFYDLASLETDAYLDLPEDVHAVVRAERHRLGEIAGLDPGETDRQFRRTALQRVLKALGTFGRLLGEGRSDYAEAEDRALRHARALLDQIVGDDAAATFSLSPLLDVEWLRGTRA